MFNKGSYTDVDRADAFVILSSLCRVGSRRGNGIETIQ